MTFSSSCSAFAAVTRHFGNARAMEEARVVIAGHDGRPVSLSPAEAHEVLYGPNREPDVCAAVWRAALSAAHSEHGPQGAQRLLLIWLSLPQLAGTVYRICERLRVDRSDVEAEMILSLLDGMRTVDPSSPRSIHTLIKEARNRGWRFARAGRCERPSAQLESLPDDSASVARSTEVARSTRRHDSIREPHRSAKPGRLRTSLRFPASTERLEGDAFKRLIDNLGLREVVRHAVRPSRRRRAGTFPLRPGGRRS